MVQVLVTRDLTRAGGRKTLEIGLKIEEMATQRCGAVSRRILVVVNVEQAEREEATREDMVPERERRLTETTQLEGEAHAEAAWDLRTHGVCLRAPRQAGRERQALARRRRDQVRSEA